MYRWKKVATVPSLLFLALFICAASVANYGQSAMGTRANSDCNEVKGKGHTVRKNPSILGGSVDLVIKDETRNAELTIELLDPAGLTNDELRQVTLSYHFALENGDSVTASGRANLTPARKHGLYHLDAVSEIVGGTGHYRNAGGEGLLSAPLELDRSEVDWSIDGQIRESGE